jgi:hypothetical protein
VGVVVIDIKEKLKLWLQKERYGGQTITFARMKSWQNGSSDSI